MNNSTINLIHIERKAVLLRRKDPQCRERTGMLSLSKVPGAVDETRTLEPEVLKDVKRIVSILYWYVLTIEHC